MVEPQDAPEQQAASQRLAELREALRRELPAPDAPEGGALLWGVDLLDPTSPAANTLLGKFLEARRGSVVGAARMAAGTLRWRRDFKPGVAAAAAGPDELTRLAGVDKEGHQVMYWSYGPLASTAVWQRTISNARSSALLREKAAVLEEGVSMMSFEPGSASAFSLVHDARDAPLASLLLDPAAQSAITGLVSAINDNYPEMSRRHVVLHAPPVISAVLALLRPVISEQTRRKFVVAPAGHELETLLTFLDVSEVLPAYGGFMGLPAAGSPAESLRVGGSGATVELPALRAGDVLEWCASVASGSLPLRAEFVPAEPRAAPVLLPDAPAALDARRGAVGGRFEASRAGSARLVLGARPRGLLVQPPRLLVHHRSEVR